MPRNPLVLAALANGAVKGLNPVRTRTLPDPGADFDTAVVTDDRDRRWTVRAPRRPAVGAAIESELVLLGNLSDPEKALLPFRVPSAAGSAALKEGGRAVVYPYLEGRPLHPDELHPGGEVTIALGRALAALHELDVQVVADAGMPVYTAAEYRDRRMAEVDQAAATGHVPTSLLTRWEKGLEDVGRWRFQPTVIHGDLVSDHVLTDGRSITAIIDWSDAKVADPADDLAWVAVGADPQAVDTVLESYSMSRREQPDRHLVERARLAGELALARWLLHGVRMDESAVVDDAVQMLLELAQDVGTEQL